MIRLENVSYAYRHGEPVLDGFDIEIRSGLTLVLGPNGCGKSTLLKLAAGVEKPDGGRILVEGLDLWKHERDARARLAYVPEHPDLTPYATLTEILRLVCRLRSEPDDLAARQLESVGLGGLGSRSVRELSLGQRRRVVLAAAMIGKTGVLVLDEPLDGIDLEMRASILRWIDRRCDAGASVLLAGHEIEAFASRSTRAVTIRDGKADLVEPLPDDPGDRRRLLENLAGAGP